MKSAGNLPKEPSDANQAEMPAVSVRQVSKLGLTLLKLLIRGEKDVHRIKRKQIFFPIENQD